MRVVITGAAGLVGGVLREGLSSDLEIAAVDLRRIEGVESTVADMAKGGRKVTRAFRNADVVVDLAAAPSVSTPWEFVYRNNLRATINAFEAAREAGVGRVVFASSNHVTGMYEQDEPYARIVRGDYEGIDPGGVPLLTAAHAIRPDSPYGVSKAFGEATARYYSEEHDISAICLRIGSCKRSDRPENAREFATLITHADLVRLVESSIRAAEDLRFGIYYGVSDNKWRFWDIADAREELRYEPQDNAERWRAD
ncbi:MAG: uronate dehydrogenase [Gaiellaceae bacterium]|jgi:nucleoside-diphosphate-sugar epimerase|nr:uronate dehydrogenase [Gaiellaceae bacterium]